MQKNSAGQSSSKAPSLRVGSEGTSRIGEGCRVKGELILCGQAEIHGEVQGKIFAEGELRIGPEAIVGARIQAETVRIEGSVVGEILCSKRLEILSGARVAGDITSPVLVIEDDVQYEGRCTMPQELPAEEGKVVVVSTQAGESH